MTERPVITLKDDSPELGIADPPIQGVVRYWQTPREDGSEPGEPLVFMQQSVCRQLNEHAISLPDREVGGLLVGEAHRTPDGTLFVQVSGYLEARYTQQGPTHLTFTTETFIDALDRLEADYPNRGIMGWYHTHPGLGVFLSSWDLFIHRSFFQKPWHVALVIDPLANHGGFFRYQAGEIRSHHPTGFYEVVDEDAGAASMWSNLVQLKSSR